jgi:hypothetical protein
MEASEQGGKEGRKVEEVEKRFREREGGGARLLDGGGTISILKVDSEFLVPGD